MEIYFSRHAKRQMKWRDITDEEVKIAITEPDNIETVEGDKKFIALKNIGKKYLKIVYIKKDNRIVVITAIDKSK